MGDDGSGSDGKEKEGGRGRRKGAERDGLGGGHGIQVIQVTANRRRGGGVSVPEAGIRCAPFPACLSHACSELQCNVRLLCVTLQLPKDIILLC